MNTITTTNNKITFGDYVYKLPDKTIIDSPSIVKQSVAEASTKKNDSFLIIKIPIKSELYSDIDFGINLVYPYNSVKTPL